MKISFPKNAKANKILRVITYFQLAMIVLPIVALVIEFLMVTATQSSTHYLSSVGLIFASLGLLVISVVVEVIIGVYF